MAGYDITQFDAPGILSIYQGAQDRRVNQMLLKRKMDMEDRATALQNQKMDLAAKAFGLKPGGGGQPSTGLAAPYASPAAASPAPVAQPSGLAGVMSGLGTPTPSPLAAPFAAPTAAPQPTPTAPAGIQPPQTLMDPSALPPRTDGLKLNQDALRQLYVLDPDMAKGLQDMAFNGNKEQFAAVARNGEVMATAAYDVKKLPMEQRRAEVEKLIPYLSANGVPADQLTPEVLDKLDLSDQGLDRLIITGRKLGDVIHDDRADNAPQWIRTENNGEVTLTPVPRSGQPLGGGSSPPTTLPRDFNFDAPSPTTGSVPASVTSPGGSTPTFLSKRDQAPFLKILGAPGLLRWAAAHNIKLGN